MASAHHDRWDNWLATAMHTTVVKREEERGTRERERERERERVVANADLALVVTAAATACGLWILLPPAIVLPARIGILSQLRGVGVEAKRRCTHTCNDSSL